MASEGWRIDYVFTFDDFRLDYTDFPSAAPFHESTMLSVSFSGCGTVIVLTDPARQSRTRTGVAERPQPDCPARGHLRERRRRRQVQDPALADRDEPQRGDGVRQDAAVRPDSRGGFDSALGALGGGKHWGAIMPDFVPTVVLDRRRKRSQPG
ncbi:hypothetical protein AB0368_33850 [Actinoplanes sp. NPDC051475]|uniref:hypothetical protein n=1 Tax=Actinoplanes sp. NPDC051475 TaxID=3157225 RepID=UPI00344EC827